MTHLLKPNLDTDVRPSELYGLFVFAVVVVVVVVIATLLHCCFATLLLCYFAHAVWMDSWIPTVSSQSHIIYFSLVSVFVFIIAC